MSTSEPERENSLNYSWTVDYLVDHYLKALEASEVKHQPFCYLFATDLFPSDVYSHLTKAMESVSGYKNLKHKDAMREDGSSTRQVIPFNEDYLGRMSESDKEFFSLIKEALDDERIGRKFFSLLLPGIQERKGRKKPEDIVAFPKSGLFCDASGYKIRPHKDVRTKLVTTQMYLPTDEKQESFGTSLYTRSFKGRINRELNKISKMQRPEFEHLETFSFLPNSGYAFVVGEKSWHGREEIPEGMGNRYSLMNIYFEDNDVPFYD